MDRGEYEAIVDASAEGFQAAGTHENLIGFFARVARKMGKCGEAPITFGGFQVTTSPALL